MLPFPPTGDLPNPGIEPRSPALQTDSLPAEPQGKPKGAQGLFEKEDRDHDLTWLGFFFAEQYAEK